MYDSVESKLYTSLVNPSLIFAYRDFVYTHCVLESIIESNLMILPIGTTRTREIAMILLSDLNTIPLYHRGNARFVMGHVSREKFHEIRIDGLFKENAPSSELVYVSSLYAISRLRTTKNESLLSDMSRERGSYAFGEGIDEIHNAWGSYHTTPFSSTPCLSHTRFIVHHRFSCVTLSRSRSQG